MLFHIVPSELVNRLNNTVYTSYFHRVTLNINIYSYIRGRQITDEDKSQNVSKLKFLLNIYLKSINNYVVELMNLLFIHKLYILKRVNAEILTNLRFFLRSNRYLYPNKIQIFKSFKFLFL